jgi:DNA-binding CsgD family transcriptional regulator
VSNTEDSVSIIGVVRLAARQTGRKSAVDRTNDLSLLTRQELECLRWCKEGKTNWEIGEILAISEKTAEFHLSNAMRKLGASNRITAVVMGIKRGMISL